MTFVKQDPSKKRPKRGDLFSVKTVEERYGVGLVVENEAKVPFSNPNFNLIYFAKRSYTDLKQFSVHDFAELLIDPIVTNNQLWLKGYVSVFRHGFPVDDFKLSSHAFSFPTGTVDEFAQPVDGEAAVFQGGIASPVLIERRVSDALRMLSST